MNGLFQLPAGTDPGIWMLCYILDPLNIDGPERTDPGPVLKWQSRAILLNYWHELVTQKVASNLVHRPCIQMNCDSYNKGNPKVLCR